MLVLILFFRKQQDQLAQDLRILLKIAKQLTHQRTEAGSLTLASAQVKFDLDTETMNPTDVEMYQLRETNKLVEEFMLLANCSVAQRIYQSFPLYACLRRHPHPADWKFEALNKSLKLIGQELNIKTSRALSISLDALQVKHDTYLNTLIRIMTTRCMEQALYFSSGTLPKEEYYHYGLAAPIYTHFTSPIRRYADVLVHRMLGAAIGIYPLTEHMTEKEAMIKTCLNMNFRHRQAQYAGRASVELFTLQYFKEKSVEENAYISRIKQNAIIVFVPRYGIEHIIYVDVAKNDEEDKDANAVATLFDYDMEKECLTLKQDGKTKLRVFDKVRVKVFVQTSKNYRSKLIMQVVQPIVPEVPQKKRKAELAHENEPSAKKTKNA